MQNIYPSRVHFWFCDFAIMIVFSFNSPYIIMVGGLISACSTPELLCWLDLSYF